MFAVLLSKFIICIYQIEGIDMRYIMFLYFLISFIAMSGCLKVDVKNALGGYQNSDYFERQFEGNANMGLPKSAISPTMKPRP